MNHVRQFRLLLASAFTLGMVACSASPTPDPTATPSLPAPTIVLVDGTPQVLNGPANPTPTPNLTQANAVQISELQYFQRETRLDVIAKLTNPLEDAIVRDAQLEVLAVDPAGNRVVQRFLALRYLFPGETTGLAVSFDLLPGQQLGSVEVRVNSGIIDRSLDYAQPLTISQPSWWANSNQPIATAWLSNGDPYTYTQVVLYAIAYNTAGQIIAGGQSLLEFAPGKDKVGIQIPMSSTEEPARVEIYPWITDASSSLEGGSWWQTIKVNDSDFVLTTDHWVGGGAQIQNQSDHLLTGTFYLLTVSDTQGRVCLVQKGFIDLIWPGEALTFSPGAARLPQESTPYKTDLLIVPGEFGEHPLAYNPLVTAQGALVPDVAESIARVSIINNLNANISSTVVFVLLRNADGQIVGGGRLQTGSVPAASSITVDVPVAVIGDLENLTVETSATIPADAAIGQ